MQPWRPGRRSRQGSAPSAQQGRSPHSLGANSWLVQTLRALALGVAHPPYIKIWRIGPKWLIPQTSEPPPERCSPHVPRRLLCEMHSRVMAQKRSTTKSNDDQDAVSNAFADVCLASAWPFVLPPGAISHGRADTSRFEGGAKTHGGRGRCLPTTGSM